MKHKFLLYITIIGAVLISACAYDDYELKEFDYTAAYFAYPQIDRTIVVDEFSSIGVGVMLGGKMQNETEEWANYEIDTSILKPGQIVLPEQYYTIFDAKGGNNEIFYYFPGKYQGFIDVDFDVNNFINDPEALSGNYALGFRLLDTSLDSIIPNKQTTIITFKFASPYFGNYYHYGRAVEVDAFNQPVDTTTYDPQLAWEFTTYSKDTLITNGLGYLVDVSNSKIKLTIENGNVNVFSADGSIVVLDEGGSTYNAETRTFFLNYSFIESSKTYMANDTLVFRNRILDGVNQWFDETGL